MASFVERLCGRFEWFDDAVEALWWGKAERGLIVGRWADMADLEWAARRVESDGIPCEAQGMENCEYPEGEYDLVAFRGPSLLRRGGRQTVHRMKFGVGLV